MTNHKRTALLLLVLLSAACEDNRLRPEGPAAPTPPPEPAAVRIDYRVIGTGVRQVTVTYFSSTQGTTQTTTELPWFLTYQTRDASTFVYLSASAAVTEFDASLIVQVFVDGVLFREARSTGFSPAITVSGEVVR